MLPLRDNAPTRTAPLVTVSLIAAQRRPLPTPP